MADKPSDSDSLDLIERMLKLMDEKGLAELEFEQGGTRIRLRKAESTQNRPTVEYIPMPQAGTPGQAAAPTPAAGPETGAVESQPTINTPMVGTFYRSPAPDAPSFVEVGQKVTVGQVVCIIEAMKLMNEIKAEVAGEITEVLVQNGESVEFGQPLFSIKPS